MSFLKVDVHIEEGQEWHTERCIRRVMERATKGILEDLQLAVSTWTENVVFKTQEEGPYRTLITTDNLVFLWVDAGTEDHIILPNRAKVLRIMTGGQPKTSTVRLQRSPAPWIKPREGKSGDTVVYAMEANVPGIEGRDITGTIAEKWQEKVVPHIVEVEIDKEFQ